MANKEYFADSPDDMNFEIHKKNGAYGYMYVGDGEHKGRFYVEDDRMSTSSLMSSAVARANIKSWRAMFGDSEGESWITIHYNRHDGEAVAIHHESLSGKQRSVLDELDSYPVICEDDMYEEESEAIVDCWDRYGAYDFESCLRDKMYGNDFLLALYNYAMGLATNTDHHVEDSDGSIVFYPDKAADIVHKVISEMIGFEPKE